MRKRVLSILLALSVILAYVPMMGVTAVAEWTTEGYTYTDAELNTPVTFTSAEPFSVETTLKTQSWTGGTIDYSVDDGTTWKEWKGESVSAVKNGLKYTVMFKGKGNSVISTYTNNWNVTGNTGNNVSVSGNIMTLLDYENPKASPVPQMAFASLFSGNKALSDASGLILPATTVGMMSYAMMFSGCSNLNDAPVLPATTLSKNSYLYMFEGCSSLTCPAFMPKAEVNAEVTNTYSTANMYKGCTSIKLSRLSNFDYSHEEWDYEHIWWYEYDGVNNPRASNDPFGPMFDNIEPSSNSTGDFNVYYYDSVTIYGVYRFSIVINEQPSLANMYTVDAKIIPTNAPDDHGDINYQWYEKTGEGVQAIEGATGKTLPSNVGAGVYYCECSSSTIESVDSDDVIITDMSYARYYGSITLNDNIDVNLTIRGIANDKLDDVMSKLSILVDDTPIDNSKISKDGDNLKCVLCSKTPQDAGETFDVKIQYDGDVVKEFEFNVRDYCRKILTNESSYTSQKAGPELIELCKAFLAYASCADLCNEGEGTDYEVGTDNKAGTVAEYLDGTTITPVSTVANPKDDGSRASLTIGSNIKLNFYIVKSDTVITNDNIKIWNSNDDYVSPANIETIEETQINIGDEENPELKDAYRITIKNIGASKLGREYRIAVNGGPALIKYGVYNYLSDAYDLIKDDATKVNDRNFYLAMYKYGIAAEKYYAALN